jgi:serine protein kinase
MRKQAMSLFSHYQEKYQESRVEEYSLQEYLTLCKDTPAVYATAAERLLLAIGEPDLIDTSKDPRLSRIFSNKIISRYKPFENF